MKSRIPATCIPLFVLFSLIVSLAGCSKEELDKMVADAKNKAGSIKESANQAIEKTKQSVQNVTDMDGSGTIQLEGEVKFGQSFIRLIPADGDRPAIVQIKSSRETPDKFPAYLIQGEVNASSLDELSGKTANCTIFAQKSDSDAVWSNQSTAPLLVSIQKDGQKIIATFQGTMVNSVTGSQASANGSLEPIAF